MRKLGVLLRETAQSDEIHHEPINEGEMASERGGARSTTVLELLRERTERGAFLGRSPSSSDEWRRDSFSQERRRLSKHSFRLIGLSCCGATWGLFRSSNGDIVNDEETPDIRHPNAVDAPAANAIQATSSPPASTPRASARVSTQGMNLATALEAERLRSEAEVVSEISVSLVRLLAETATSENSQMNPGSTNSGSIDRNCCVCMVREKGSALIPCGHTFCRVCARELCLNRGSCPLCNKAIFDILDIF